jgi:DNA-binding MarR family transcriptional regulator
VTDSQRILDSVRRLVRLLRLSDRAAQTQVGLSAAQLFVLHEVGRTPDLSLNDLAERTRTDQSSVSVVVTRLVDAGYIERRRAEDDGRRLVLSLTKSGRAALISAPPAPQTQLLDIIDALPAAERKRFATTFARIVDAMGAGNAPATMLFDEEMPKSKKRKARA